MCQEPNKVPAKCTLPHIGPSEVRATSGATQDRQATILSPCGAFLEHRYKWRHDSIVTIIVENIKANKPAGIDIEGKTVNGLTKPSNIAVTAQRPDIVVTTTNCLAI